MVTVKEKYFKTKYRPVGIFPSCGATAQLGPRLPRFEVYRSLSLSLSLSPPPPNPLPFFL